MFDMTVEQTILFWVVVIVVAVLSGSVTGLYVHAKRMRQRFESLQRRVRSLELDVGRSQ